MRYLLLFVMATLTAVGQSTKPAPDPPLCLMKKGDYYVACPKPKKHKAPVKPAWDMTPPIDDGVAHWQAPKPPVPEAIKDGTICDHLPETHKITCLMNLVAPEKAIVPEPDPIKTAQDGYDCQITEKIVAFAQKDYPPNYEGDVLTKKVIAAISCTLKEPK